MYDGREGEWTYYLLTDIADIYQGAQALDDIFGRLVKLIEDKYPKPPPDSSQDQ
jgi:hypothetical protein